MQNIERKSNNRLNLFSYLIFFFVVILYSPTLKYDFVFDDFVFIIENPAIKSWDRIPDYFTDADTFSSQSEEIPRDRCFRPLRNVVYLFEYKMFNLNPQGWHLASLFFHAVNTAFLFRFLVWLYRKYTNQNSMTADKKSLTVIAAAALLWGFHPVNTEVVAWVKGQDDILWTLFGLGAIWSFLKFAEKQSEKKQLVLSFCFFVIALFMKESAIILPLVTGAVLLFLSLRNKNFTLNIKNISVLGIQSGIVMLFLAYRHHVIGQTAQGEYLGGSFSACMSAMMSAWCKYLQLILWPFPPTQFIADYDNYPIPASWLAPEAFVPAIILVIALTAFLFWTLKKRYYMALAGAAWFFIAMIPFSNIVPMMQIMAERFLYFPAIGLSLIALSAAPAFMRADERKFRILILLTGLLLAGLISATLTRMPVWKNDFDLMEDTMKRNPRSQRPAFNYAFNLFKAGDVEGSYQLLNKIFDNKNISVNNLMFYMNVSFAYHGNTHEIEKLLEQASRTTPSRSLLRDYGLLMLGKKNYPEAIRLFKKSIEISKEPLSSQYVDLATAYYYIGDKTQALQAVAEAQKIDADDEYAIRLKSKIIRGEPVDVNTSGTKISVR